MTNTTVTAVQNAADQHIETAKNGVLWAVRQAAASPFQAAKDWFIGHAWRDLESADQESHRVSLFNDKLESCNACIAPEDFADGDTEAQLEGAIQHFDDLAAECIQYAADLRKIQMRRF